MNKMIIKKSISWMLTAVLVLVLAGCKNEKVVHPNSDIPQSPDYTDSSQWYVTDRAGVADVFYIISTETGDYTLADGTVCHYANTYDDAIRQPLLGEMEGVDALLSGNLNFYSPYYRQCTLQSFVSDSLAATRLLLPTDDVRRAFEYYLSHKNADRPFILAGFSQGAMIALQLLSEMDDVTYSRMVAAYIIGASIPQETLDEYPNIVAATGPDDTGVTICYNSVREPSCTMWPRSAACINPVNWRTDATPATLITEPSPLVPLNEQQKDTLTITMDPVSNLILVDGFTATDYILPLIGKEGNYHSREIWLYREQLKENMAERVERFRK
jgi:hypothetical protein